MAYKTIAEIGRGGFGIVEQVQDDAGRNFARKTLLPPPKEDPAKIKQRFEREVKYQRSIDHENVVAVLDEDLSSDPPWFIMPLADGTLEDDLKADKTLAGTPQKALFDILAGMEEMHLRGYVHRDLKPGNVLRFDGVETPSYAISDFGLMAVTNDGQSSLTPSNMVGGSEAYRAPECAINFKRASRKSDIYSFGAILHDIFGPPGKRLPHIELSADGAIGPVIERCTKTHPHRRFKDVGQLREALFEALPAHEFQARTDEEQRLTAILAKAELSEEDWDAVLIFIEAADGDARALGTAFRGLTRDHINQLAKEEGEGLLSAIGAEFASFCRKGDFSFEYCDVLASKGQLFFRAGDVELRAQIALAMMQMGINHHRFFVERVFRAMVGPDADDMLMDRILVEADVLGIDFAAQLDKVRQTIGLGEDTLHEKLMGRISDG